MQSYRQIQWGLSAELHNHPLGFFNVDDVHNILERQRLEVKPVGSVIVGRDCLRVTIDHDSFETGVAQCECGMTTTIVELDPLPNPIWAAAQDHDAFLAVGGAGF